MYKKDFDKLKEIPHKMLLFGNTFYLQEYEEKIVERFKDANLLKMYYDDFDYEKAKIHLSESSLFGETSVLIIKHSKIPPNLEKLINYVDDSYLFFFYYGVKKPKIFGKDFVRFFEPTLREKMEYIDKYSQKYGVNFTMEAKKFLASSIEASFLKKEVEKLSLYSENLDVAEVKELIFLYKEESFEELFVSMLKGEDFFEKLNNMLEITDFRRIMPALINYLRDLYFYNLYIKTTGKSDLKELLGYKLPFDVERERLNLCVKFKDRDYYELLKNLTRFELEMRKSRKNKEAIFWEAMSYLKTFNSF